MKNKRGLSTGWLVIIIGAILVLGFTQGWFAGLGGEGAQPTPQPTPSECPSSGLTTVTLNTQEALASSATNAQTDVYVYDNNGFVKKKSTGSDGEISFDVECGKGKSFDAIVLNETTDNGYYAQKFTIDASGPTDKKNLKMYQFGQINLVSVASSTDPTGGSNIAAGAGKTCGYTITFTENESVSAFNKPLIMCEVNTTVVEEVTNSDASAANTKKPSRISSASGNTFYTFEVGKMLKSTDAAQKVSGKIKFLDSASIATGDTMDCRIVDQANFKKADYQTMSLDEGFVLAAENTENRNDVGAPDTGTSSLTYNSTATSYC